MHYGTQPSEMVGRFRGTLFQTLARLWFFGMAREPGKLGGLAVFADSSSSSYGFLTSAELQSCLSAWEAVIKREPLPVAASAQLARINNGDLLIGCLTAIGGSGKSRMPFPQRLELVARISGQTSLASYKPAIWSLLVHHGLFTVKELVENAPAVMKCADLFAAPHLEDFAAFARVHGNFETASRVLEKAAVRWSAIAKNSPTHNVDRCLADRAAILIRQKKFEAARRCLDQVNLADRAFATVAKHAALIRMLPPSPAPAR